jgi:hypothetical protein
MAREVKITKEHRLTAIAALMLHAGAKRCLELARTEHLLGDRVYEEMFSPGDRARMAELPETWLPRVSRIDANAAGWMANLHYLDPSQTLEDMVRLSMSDHRAHYIGEYGPGQLDVALSRRSGWRFPTVFNGRTWPYPTYNIESAELGADIQAHMQTKRAWMEQATALHGQIRSTIMSFKGLRAMLVAIPELKELAPALQRELDEAGSPKTALSPDVKGVMCAIARVRGEEREGCCADDYAEAAAALAA